MSHSKSQLFQKSARLQVPEPTIASPYSNAAVKSDQYFYKAFVWAWEKGLIGNTAHDPNAPCSRSDVVTYLWKLDGSPKTGSSNFTDVPASAPYAQAVAWAVQHGVTNGTSATTFSPDAICTRGQIVTFLWRAAGCPEPIATSSNFTDVDLNSYYAPAVLWAVENGITGGTTDTTFSPNQICSRAQAVTFLYRAAGLPEVGTVAEFFDVVFGSYYADAVSWAAENGITGGTTETTFSPANSCTRAQIVTFLYRYLGE